MAEPSQGARTPYVNYEEPQPSLLSNILAIVGFIILIVVVIWGLVHLAGISRTWFSSFFGSSNTIEVTAPESVVSGTPFTVSWRYDEPTDGIYAFLYSCQSDLQLQTPSPSGSMNGIPCGAAFTIVGESKEVSVTPHLGGTEALDVPISILFTPSATGTQAQGSVAVRVEPASSPAPLPQPSPAPAPTPNPAPMQPVTPHAPATPADLSVRITSVTVDGYGNGVAIFEIANVGGSSSGTYYFTANLPTISGYTYASPAQSSLSAGSHVVSTLRFSGATAGTFSVSITTSDTNPTNNYASQYVNAAYYGSYNYNYPYQYQTQYASTYYPHQQYQYGYQNYSPYTQYSPYSTYYPYAY